MRLVYQQELGIELPTFREQYDSSMDAEAVQKIFSENHKLWDRVTPGEERKFDGIWAKCFGVETHVLVYCGDGQAIHVAPEVGVSVVSIRKGLWKDRVQSFWRHRAAR